MTRTSPERFARAWPRPARTTLRVLATAVLVLLISRASFGQDFGATAASNRPLRRLDGVPPIAVTEPDASVSLAGEPAKTPIRRVADVHSDSPGSRPSSAVVWALLGAIVSTALLISWWTRRHPAMGTGGLPATVFQVLGHSVMGRQHSVALLRLGEKVLLVSTSGPALQTLAVITDPAEVAAVTAECLSPRRGSVGAEIGRDRSASRRAEIRIARETAVDRPLGQPPEHEAGRV